uniref:Uncharacterized protein n=1 Tax=Cacopsylla melanoneura TaxID=428564 RepID=A0A8D8SLN0_9HEMI
MCCLGERSNVLPWRVYSITSLSLPYWMSVPALLVWMWKVQCTSIVGKWALHCSRSVIGRVSGHITNIICKWMAEALLNSNLSISPQRSLDHELRTHLVWT